MGGVELAMKSVASRTEGLNQASGRAAGDEDREVNKGLGP